MNFDLLRLLVRGGLIHSRGYWFYMQMQEIMKQRKSLNIFWHKISNLKEIQISLTPLYTLNGYTTGHMGPFQWFWCNFNFFPIVYCSFELWIILLRVLNLWDVISELFWQPVHQCVEILTKIHIFPPKKSLTSQKSSHINHKSESKNSNSQDTTQTANKTHANFHQHFHS